MIYKKRIKDLINLSSDDLCVSVSFYKKEKTEKSDFYMKEEQYQHFFCIRHGEKKIEIKFWNSGDVF